MAKSIIGCCLLIIFLSLYTSREITPVPSTDLPEPVQRTPRSAETWTEAGYTVQSLAEYDVTARVISIESYWFGRESDLSPLDFALGWGRMTQPEVYRALNVSQGGRWYSYSWDRNGPPIPVDEIVRSSANTHLVPGSKYVRSQLKKVRAGQVVRLKGHLVHITAPDGWQWTSSITRTDSGNGSCELLWVEDAEIVTPR